MRVMTADDKKISKNFFVYFVYFVVSAFPPEYTKPKR